jgi:two-component sensor histidine kinase
MSRLAAFWRLLTDSLSGRMALFLAVTLLPLGIVAFVQTKTAMNEAQKRSEVALTGEILRDAAAEVLLIQRAQGLVRALASLPLDILLDPVRCVELMQRTEASTLNYSHVAYVPLGGVTTCSSSGQTLDFSDSPQFAKLSAADTFGFAVNHSPLVSEGSILIISHPVVDERGNRVGLVAVSLPHARLELARLEGAGEAAENLHHITFDSAGGVLSAPEQYEGQAGLLPEGPTLADLASRPGPFTARSKGGSVRTYTVVDLVPGELFALASWPADIRVLPGFLGAVPPLIFPALMWLASLVVAMFAAELQVTRFVRELRQSMKAFAGGNRIVTEPDFSRAPAELREVGEAYAALTDTILHDEAQMEDMLHQKEVLLREVHHRVKNNLQLIASIMNMQMRQAHSIEAKALMKNLHDRVMSLATIHQGLYQTSGLADISVDELLDDIVRQLLRMGAGPGRRFEVRTEFEPVRLAPDQAVPLGLLLTEVVTNALKYASADSGEPLWLRVALSRTGPAGAVMTVENSLAASGAAEPAASALPGATSGLGAKLTQAFARQLGGRLAVEQSTTSYSVNVDFDLRGLSDEGDGAAATDVESAAVEGRDAG